PFSILFRGCSFLIMYQVGVLAALQELSPDILNSASRIYGASSGSVVATLALCGCDIGKGYALSSTLCLKKLNVTFMPLVASSRMYLFGGKPLRILKHVLNKHLPTNAHQLVSGKLHLIVTRLCDWRCMVVSEFASREDLMQAVICSCYIPVLFGCKVPVYRGVCYVDGELAMWQADFVSKSTITVSAFAGEYDICPRDGSAAFFTFQISDCILQISQRNFCRFQCGF
ncbi:PLPL1 protein, partial [Aegotheles bennettii]|nr:PLPL1 protein [Aegotheles bennettii]